MTKILTDEQLKDAFIEFVATNVYNNINDVTYQSVLNYMKRNCEMLIYKTVSTAIRMYTLSKDYKKDIEYLEERRREWAKEWEGEWE